MFQSQLFLQAVANPDLLTIGISIVTVFILLVGLWRALLSGIAGAMIGAFIGPVFLEVSVEEGMMAGALIFAIIGFFSTGD